MDQPAPQNKANPPPANKAAPRPADKADTQRKGNGR